MKKEIDRYDLISLSYFNWFAYLIQRWRLTPVKIFTIVLLYNLVTNIGSALYFNAWREISYNGKSISGLSNEPGAWVIFSLAQPMVFALAVWLNTAPDNMINKLAKSCVLKINSDVKKILEWGHRKIRHRFLYISAWAISIGVQTFVILLEKGILGNHNPTWINIHPIVFWSRTLIAIPIYYLLAINVFSICIVIMVLNRIMRLKNIIKVEIFHSDEAGGLGSIGKFVSNLGYLSFTFAATIVVFFWQAKIAGQQTTNTGWLIVSIISSVIYLLTVPIIFFWPLLSTHRAMLAYKKSILQEISSELNKLYSSAIDKTNKITEIKIEQIKNLTELRAYTLNLPTWPFSEASARKYYSLSISPIFSFALSILYDWMYDWVTSSFFTV